MKLLKDKKIVILALILTAFTVGYFIIVNKISYAFSANYNLNEIYHNTIETIKKCAVVYAEKNKDLFKNEKTVYIKVQDLIDSNLLATDENNVITNPLDENKTLNSNVIKLKYENDKIIVEVDS